MKKIIYPLPSFWLILLLIAVLFIPFFLLFFFYPALNSLALSVFAVVYLFLCALLMFFVHTYYSKKISFYRLKLLNLKQKFIPGYNQFNDDEIL